MEHSLLASSVLDEGWLDLVDTSADVLVTAQGLLMYLPPADVHALIVSCANRIRSGALLFDAVSRVLSERSQRGIQGPGGYRPPPWLWGVDGAEREWIRARPNVAELRALRLPRGCGSLFGVALPPLSRLPGLRNALFSIMLARLRAPA